MKTVKRALTRARTPLAEGELDDWSTLAARATFLINSRPCDPRYWTDLSRNPICVNDLLYPLSQGCLLESPPAEQVGRAEEACRRFWSAWQLQVPPELLPRQKWLVKPKEWRVGDIVLVRRLQAGGVQVPRGIWPKGRIIRLEPSTDGVIRKMVVVLPNQREIQVVPHHLVLVHRDPEMDESL